MTEIKEKVGTYVLTPPRLQIGGNAPIKSNLVYKNRQIGVNTISKRVIGLLTIRTANESDNEHFAEETQEEDKQFGLRTNRTTDTCTDNEHLAEETQEDDEQFGLRTNRTTDTYTDNEHLAEETQEDDEQFGLRTNRTTDTYTDDEHLAVETQEDDE
ncbi:hypothetical protein AVEN_208982-1 [Araneus ventricosus]|uniref:Uncharacterized protein n=1 Tax=Araneus ventricosus TaxID=182803 RepID=A0A4Y2CRJ7_ARAVE|nr:hypothetical protein AVEN_208982-1 [Araneus ventricosus]